MSAARKHRHRLVGNRLEDAIRDGDRTILGGSCDAECPSCQNERKDAEEVRDKIEETVMSMWLQAVRAGERTVEMALREVTFALSKLRPLDAAMALASFTKQALCAQPPKVKSRPPHRPTAWDETNYALVNLFSKDGAPKNDVNNAEALELQTAFAEAAKKWGEVGILIGADEVQRRYYRHRKKVYKPFAKYNSH